MAPLKSDARAVLKEALKADLTSIEVARLDFDGNGNVNNTDVRRILQQVIST